VAAAARLARLYGPPLLRHPGTCGRRQQERFRALQTDDDPERLAAWARGPHGLSARRRGHARAAAHGLHAQPRAPRDRLVPDQGAAPRLAPGEDVFARYLLCGEPAQNNGNWQWIAGTGTDPAPYFRRMYNPALHQERFDPQGTYVRRWIPSWPACPTPSSPSRGR
jgi:deoxyribodipyrimidine photo-lyase